MGCVPKPPTPKTRGFLLFFYNVTFATSWAYLGPMLAHLGSILALCWPILAHLGPILAPSWPVVAPSWPVVAPSWRILAPSWPHLGPSWSDIGPSWPYVGTILAHLDASWPLRPGAMSPSWPWHPLNVVSASAKQKEGRPAPPQTPETRGFLLFFAT